MATWVELLVLLALAATVEIVGAAFKRGSALWWVKAIINSLLMLLFWILVIGKLI